MGCSKSLPYIEDVSFLLSHLIFYSAPLS